jgi:hypothetical protein
MTSHRAGNTLTIDGDRARSKDDARSTVRWLSLAAWDDRPARFAARSIENGATGDEGGALWFFMHGMSASEER